MNINYFKADSHINAYFYYSKFYYYILKNNKKHFKNVATNF